MKKRICFSILVASFLMGCELESVVDHGSTCPPRTAPSGSKIGMIGALSCSSSGCGENFKEYSDNVRYGYCPELYSDCGFDPVKDIYFCAKVACNSNEHIYNDACEPDSLLNCGVHGNECANALGWESGECVNAVCIPTSCKANYSIVDGKCTPTVLECRGNTHLNPDSGECDNNTEKDCGVHGNDCTTQIGWDSGECRNSACVPTTCAPGYVLRDSKCVPRDNCPEGMHLNSVRECVEDSVEHCGSEENDCTAITGWKSGNCERGVCTASECKNWYILKDGKCEALTGCPAGEHIYEGTCEEDSLENCGEHDNRCPDLKAWKTGQCTGGECVIETCLEQYKLEKGSNVCVPDCTSNQYIENGACKESDLKNCGGSGFVCSNSVGWSQGECTNNICIVSECEKGYIISKNSCVIADCSEEQHIYNNQCEEDSLENCGEHDVNCEETVHGWGSGQCSQRVCVPEKCAEGYCMNSLNQCVIGKSDSKACGITGEGCEVCPSGKMCVEGSCIETTCEPGTHVYENGCEADSLENCGGHGGKCELPGASVMACNNGSCQAVACEGNYHLYDGLCERDDNTNCGGHSTTEKSFACSENLVDHSVTVACIEGKCNAESCAKGYHVNNGVCEADSNENCGKVGNACVTNNVVKTNECEDGVCINKECTSVAYMDEDGVCRLNDNDNCGAVGKKCQASDFPNTAAADCSGREQCDITWCNNDATYRNGECIVVCDSGRSYCNILGNEICCNGGCFHLDYTKACIYVEK